MTELESRITCCFRFIDHIQDTQPFRSMAKRFKSARVQGIGFIYLMKLTVLISVLMIGNSYLVGKVVFANVGFLPDVLDDVRLYLSLIHI